MLQLLLVFTVSATGLLKSNRYRALSKVEKTKENLHGLYCSGGGGVDDRSDLGDRFLAWAAREGIKSSKCEVHEFPEGLRGLRATEDISDGEIFIQVPLRLCFTSDAYITKNDIAKSKGANSEGGPIVSSVSDQFEWPVRLAIRIITENRSTQSIWGSYVATLPQPAVPVSGRNQREVDLASTLPVHWNDVSQCGNTLSPQLHCTFSLCLFVYE